MAEMKRTRLETQQLMYDVTRDVLELGHTRYRTQEDYGIGNDRVREFLSTAWRQVMPDYDSALRNVTIEEKRMRIEVFKKRIAAWDIHHMPWQYALPMAWVNQLRKYGIKTREELEDAIESGRLRPGILRLVGKVAIETIADFLGVVPDVIKVKSEMHDRIRDSIEFLESQGYVVTRLN